ncbi:hypothetical protein VTK26DRAFT_2577 [Humicola hyalothermophila]
MGSGPGPEVPSKRRPHRKSRTGCAECRRRRIKCGEEKPRCRSCVRHGAICQYPEPAGPCRAARSVAAASPTAADAAATLTQLGSSRDGDVTTAASIPSPSIIDGDGVPFGASTDLNFSMADLSLLHHWTVSTSHSLVQCPSIDRIWQAVLPQIGFRFPFVMHAILSLAALHLGHIVGPPHRHRYTIEAVRHHNSALRGFRETINQPSPENADALFACSTLNVIYVFGVSPWSSSAASTSVDAAEAGSPHHPFPQTRDQSGSCKSRVLGAEWMPMVRGVRAVLPAVMDRVRAGPLGALVALEDWGSIELDRDGPVEDERFRALRSAWAGQGTRGGDEEVRVYDETLDTFRKCYLYIVSGMRESDDGPEGRGFNRAWAGPLIFLFMAPDEFLMRLHQRQPAALVIFAHFGAVLHRLQRFWFLDGWARNIVEVVDDILGDYWKPWTAWPREVVGLG